MVGGIGAKNVVPTVGEGEHWKGARTVIRTDRKGVQSTEVLPQVGACLGCTGPFEWVLERDLDAHFTARYPKGSEFRIVGGKTAGDHERVVNKLKALCPTFVYGGVMNPPFSGDGKVMLSVEYQVSRVVERCLCKIGFNYMALICGDNFVLSSEFDDMRSFIRDDVGDNAGRISVKQKPIMAQEIITGNVRTFSYQRIRYEGDSVSQMYAEKKSNTQGIVERKSEARWPRFHSEICAISSRHELELRRKENLPGRNVRNWSR